MLIIKVANPCEACPNAYLWTFSHYLKILNLFVSTLIFFHVKRDIFQRTFVCWFCVFIMYVSYYCMRSSLSFSTTYGYGTSRIVPDFISIIVLIISSYTAVEISSQISWVLYVWSSLLRNCWKPSTPTFMFVCTTGCKIMTIHVRFILSIDHINCLQVVIYL